MQGTAYAGSAVFEDSEENVLAVVERAAGTTVRGLFTPAFGMTLRRGNREWYYDRLDEHYPGLSTQYRKQYGDSYVCTSPQSQTALGGFSPCL